MTEWACYISSLHSIKGHWISEELLQCLQDLREAGFSVRGVVTDNHSANVAAFKILLDKYDGDKKYYFTLPGSLNKTYVFFDTVHLLKTTICLTEKSLFSRNLISMHQEQTFLLLQDS